MVLKISFLLAFSATLVLTQAFRLQDTPLAKRHQKTSDKSMKKEEITKCVDSSINAGSKKDIAGLVKDCMAIDEAGIGGSASQYAPVDPKGQYAPVDPKSQYAPLDPEDQYAPVDPKDQYAPVDPKSQYFPAYPEGQYAPADPKGQYAPADPKGQYAPVDPNGQYIQTERNPYEGSAIPDTEILTK